MGTNHRRFRPRPPLTGGVALVMTLITLSILAILLIGFLSTMLVERRAAGTYEETQRAKLIAQGAVSHAIDLLRTNIPEPARLAERGYIATPVAGITQAPGENWVVNPGRLTVIREVGSPQFIPLHTGEVTSGPAPGAPRDADSVDLNEPLPGDSIPVITGTAGGVGRNRPPMRVQWVNLLKDPSSTASRSNPLVGRYAFWMDDECARLNFNTALGKPELTAGTKFGNQYNAGFITPLFDRGDGATTASGTGIRKWALGRPQSVNLDVLFDSPTELKADKLLAQTFLHGFARYPEAIKDFVDVPSAKDWYDKNRFNLSFYNRSPEFNAFGKSRLFTSLMPLSLEGGPSYQHPFIHDPSGGYAGGPSEILHLNSLFGAFGFDKKLETEDGTGYSAGNTINKQQFDMIMGYLSRKWPGYNTSFVDKYTREGCQQLALNMMVMARLATAPITTSGADTDKELLNFTKEYAARSTSVMYYPTDTTANNPERCYWKPPITLKTMLPQTPGPFITEVRLHVKAIAGSTENNAEPVPPKNKKANLNGVTQPRYIQYYYSVEYYMPPMGPVLYLNQFPTRVDYLDIKAVQTSATGTKTTAQQIFTGKLSTNTASNWRLARDLGRMEIVPTIPGALATDPGPVIGPAGASYPGADVKNRYTYQTEIFTLGSKDGTADEILPYTLEENGNYNKWVPFVFDGSKSTTATVNINFRLGLGIAGDVKRPRQMIPLGETAADTLQSGDITVSLAAEQEQVISWQIADPRLSWNAANWKKEGPGVEDILIGTEDAQNSNEPAEDSSEKSKFRYIQRAPDDAKMLAGGTNYPINRGDEYETAGRTASPGYWSLLHTGMQSGVPWQTIDLGPASAQNSPPDWLLLDLFGPTYPMAHDQWKKEQKLPDEFSTASFMNSTAGQVNLNSRVYPQTPYFQVPERRKPLEGVFKNLRSDNDVSSLLDQIATYQTDAQFFNYVGELANVPGYDRGSATQWQRESLLRNMAGVLTTKSNTFGVWGVSQVVKKIPANLNKSGAQFARFESGDQVVGEKRFYALVERYLWTGRDGVPGNAHTGTDSKWDRLAKQTANISAATIATDTLFQLPGSPPLLRNGTQQQLGLDANGTYPEFDGPERVGTDDSARAALGNVTYRSSTLENAYNPPQPVIKYRVVYFKYLDQ